jgi:gamma-glutamyltranspeptidase/glutathione hydrolase
MAHLPARFGRATLLASWATITLAPLSASAQQTQKPPLHGSHWMAITGKPLGATAGAMIFNRGGNAVDAACAMLAAVATMWDQLHWGGETQALIFDPRTGKVIGINALGMAPSGATPEFFRGKGMAYPPDQGPLAALTPGTAGGLMVMLAEYGTMSLKEVLEPAMQMADGYAIENDAVVRIERNREALKGWKYSRELFFTHPGEAREIPSAGEIFRQADLAATLRKLVEAEQDALRRGADRKEAIQAAYDRFYKGDIAREFVRGAQEMGALHTMEDLARWKVRVEEPVRTTYKDIEVYKLNVWTQGPTLLQALNLLEPLDLRGMGYNSTRYLHTIYQAMNLAYADRDFYYGDIYAPPEEPVAGLLSKEYARERAKLIRSERNDPDIKPGDPYRFMGRANPYLELLKGWPPAPPRPAATSGSAASAMTLDEAFYAGTTSIQAADAAGWVVSITPSGGWQPAVVAGRTGIGMSQRMQSFVVDERENPFNVVAPGKQPRVTLTPSLALKEGKPYLSFAVQGGDGQDQNLLQFFLNVVEFGMTVQEAAEAGNINSYQMRASFGSHASRPGRMLAPETLPDWVRRELGTMGYTFEFQRRTSGPINAILFDRKHGTMWGASSNHGEDYGIAW